MSKDKGITLAKAIDTVERYQAWRRGESNDEQPSPLMVGACIDLVLAAAKKHQANGGNK